MHADAATATAVVSYAELSKRLGVDVSYAGDGRVKASKTVTIGDNSLNLQLSAAPVIADGALSFTKTAVNGLGSLSGQLPDVVQQIFEEKFSLQNFPFGVRVQSLRVTDAGIELTLTGSDLTYDRSSS